MNTHDKARYNIEHKLLPRFLFQGKGKFMGIVIEKRGRLIKNLWESIDGTEKQYPFCESDITIMPRIYTDGNDNRMIIRIGMPEPVCNPLCRYIYLCFNSKTESVAYFTSEFSVEVPYMLCGWSSNNIHINYGRTPLDSEKEFEQVIHIFNDAIKGGNKMIVS